MSKGEISKATIDKAISHAKAKGIRPGNEERWLVLPYPPSVNHYYRNVNGRTLISAEGRAYRVRVAVELGLQRPKPVRGPMRGRLSLEIEVNPPDKRRRDLDNVLKALLDALQHGGLYEDDSQIEEIHLRRLAPHPGGMVRVRCTEVK